MKLLTRLKLIASGFGYDRDCNYRNRMTLEERDKFAKDTGIRVVDTPKCGAHGPWAKSVMHDLGLELMNVKQCRKCGHMEKADGTV